MSDQPRKRGRPKGSRNKSKLKAGEPSTGLAGPSNETKEPSTQGLQVSNETAPPAPLNVGEGMVQRKQRLRQIQTVKKGVWISAADLGQMKFKEREWVTPGLVRRGGLGLCYGIMKTGKSALWTQYAIAAAIGRKFFDLPTTKSTVLYVTLEGPDDDARLALDRLSSTGKLPKFLILSTMDRFPFDRMKAEIENGVKLYKPSLVILDPLLEADEDFPFSGGNKRIATVLRDLRKWAVESNFMLLLIHHSTKDQKKDFLLGALGPVAMTAIPDVIFQVTRPRGKTRGTIKVSGRGIEEREIYMDYVGGVWRMSMEQEPDDEKLTELKGLRLALLKAIQPAGPKQVAEAFGITANNAGVWLTRMVAEGQVIKSEVKGKYEVAPDEDETDVTEEPKKRRRITFEDEKDEKR